MHVRREGGAVGQHASRKAARALAVTGKPGSDSVLQVGTDHLRQHEHEHRSARQLLGDVLAARPPSIECSGDPTI